MEVIVLFWLGLSLGTGLVAKNRGRRMWLWMVLGVVLTPLLAFALLMAMTNLKVQDFVESVSQSLDATHVRCPQCAEYVLPEAKVCKYCNSRLIPQDPKKLMASTQEKINEQVAEIKASELNVIIVAGAAIVFGLLVWLFF